MQGNMVRATLDDLKTQTRRVMKPQPPEWIKDLGYDCFTPKGHISGRGMYEGELAEKFFKCPYGVRGDRLWVRETWKPTGLFCGSIPRDTKACGRFAYRADRDQLSRDKFIIWRPSIFMPRWASRLTLKLTNVRGERIQDITEEDARAEGCLNDVVLEYDEAGPIDYRGLYAVERFEVLWNTINAKPKPVKKWPGLPSDPGNIIAYVSYPWDESSRDQRTEINGKPHICYPNPWVWALTFKEVKK